MKINFKRVDDEYYGVEEYIKPVAELAAKYDIFTSILCEILNTYDTYSERIVNDVARALKLYKNYKIDNMDEHIKTDYDLFSQKVYDFYWNIIDDDFGEKIRIFDENLYRRRGLRYAEKRLQRYRGILFEEIICAMVKPRFEDSKFCMGCRVYINRMRIMARHGEGNASHKETIDVAGWNELACYGEFYECKINPIRFGIENYRYFEEIKKALDENRTNKYIIALVSSDSKEHLKAQKDYLEKDEHVAQVDFELIGREDIFKILNYKIPEIA